MKPLEVAYTIELYWPFIRDWISILAFWVLYITNIVSVFNVKWVSVMTQTTAKKIRIIHISVYSSFKYSIIYTWSNMSDSLQPFLEKNADRMYWMMSDLRSV